MKNKLGQFLKGMFPFNKGKKRQEYMSQSSIEKVEETQFKEGITTLENHPSWKGGIQKPKRDCIHIVTDTNKRIRRPKKVYEENFGPVPYGYVIFHKDENKYNDHPSNLEAISRAELLRRNLEKKKQNENKINKAAK